MAYDVFISFRNNTPDGNPTVDRTIAERLRLYLQSEDIEVFMSGDSAGDAMRALDEAKVLVVIGSDPEYLSAGTVREEYSRFIDAMNRNEKPGGQVVTLLEDMTEFELPPMLALYPSFRTEDIGKCVRHIVSALGRPRAQSDCAQEIPEPDVWLGASVHISDLKDTSKAPHMPPMPAAPIMPPDAIPPMAEPSMPPPPPMPSMAPNMPAPPTPPMAPSMAPSMPAPPMPPMPSMAPSMAPSRPKSAKRPAAVRVKPAKIDKTAFSVLSPERCEPGKYAEVSVYMYTKSQRKIVERAIKQAQEAVHETQKSGFAVARGSMITVELHSDDVEIKDNVDSREWTGDCALFDFRFFMPENYAKKQAAFTCYVSVNGLQITRLFFTVDVRAQKRTPVKVKRSDNKSAFVSYSHRDSERVIAQLVAIQEIAPKMKFWLDNQSLSAGDVWRAEIERAINKTDVFLLFWSLSAKQSEEVRKEWTYALRKRGLRHISPVPLDPPDICPPPKELEELHFGDSSFYYNEDMSKLSFTDCKNAKLI